MTDTTTDSTESAEEDRPLADVHLAEKQRLVDAFHQYAAARGWCSDFDRICVEVGLPPREDFARWSRDRGEEPEGGFPTLTGEDTVEAFQAWKTDLERAIHKKADHYGLGDTFDEFVESLGLRPRPPLVTETVEITGQFRVEMTVRVREGDDVISALPERRVRAQVRDSWYSDDEDGVPRVTWKATVKRDHD